MDGATDFIEPPRIVREIGGLTVVVSPMSTRMLAQLLRLIQPALDELVLLGEGGMFESLAAGEPQTQDLLALAGLLSQHGDSLIDATALLARVDKTWLGDQTLDRSAALLADVIKVNADFFAQAMPGFAALVPRGGAPTPEPPQAES